MSALSQNNFGAAWFRASDEHASFFVSDYFEANSTRTSITRARFDVAAFMCHEVCLPPERNDQIYLFDRDEWRKSAPQLEEDVVPPAPFAHHFDERWHERWSMYLLISAEGSGINFHRHTNAFNGLINGRKRWLLYPPHVTPPQHTLGALPWLQEVYQPSWAQRGDVAGELGLQQCMQGEGTL